MGQTSRPAVWQTAATGFPDRSRGTLGASNKTEPYHAGYSKSSVHVIGTGTPTGAPKLFASNDCDPNNVSDKWNGTWEDVSSKLNPTMTAPAGAGFSYLIGLDGLPFRSFYWDYTRSAGTGEVRATWGSEIV
jgi:hypothetical protein